MKALNVFFAGNPQHPVLVGQLQRYKRQLYFEYDSTWLKTGFALSPFHLPLSLTAQKDDTGLWQGLQGAFNDSLPDGWGLLLMDRALRQAGIDPRKISPLDRLAWLGNRTMGALIYEPATHGDDDSLLIELQQLADNARAVYQGSSDTVLPALFRAGGSSGGARPKALVATKGTTMITAEADIPADFTPWLVKFNAKDDLIDAGNIEYAYSLMAQDAGLKMPITCLMEDRYFAVQRFDRMFVKGQSHYQRQHTHTLGNMIGADFRQPSLDYSDLLQVVSNITQSHTQLCSAFRQMVFNIATHNRDDHSKNFAFIWNKQHKKWQLSPAYDLMFSTGIYGEHTMTVAGEGKAPQREHIAKIAQKFGLDKVMDTLIDEVNDVVMQWKDYAQKAGVSNKNTVLLDAYIQCL